MTESRTSITPQLIETVAGLIEAGNYPKSACEASGLSYKTYLEWIKRGEGRNRHLPATPEYVAFAQRMRQAEAKAEVQVVDMVVKAIPKDPAIGLRFLGRRWKERWSESVEVNVNWLSKAILMVQNGEVTLEMLESELGPELTSEVRAQIEAPVEECEFVEVVEENALQLAE